MDDEELKLILHKVKASELNKSQYLRKMAIDGFIIKQDLESIRTLTQEINKIGININQIAKHINETGIAYNEDIRDVKGMMERIWQLLKSELSEIQ